MTFALADCNNFYVSCERAFDPSLKNRPVVVLSSNDGCVISRSPEAKQIGITMGLPFFKARDLIRSHHIAVFSSNYALYGSMSRRVMEIMAGFPVEREVYSIDEAFLKLHDADPGTQTELCRSIRQRIMKWTGIPVSIGIGQTKTIAKMANRIVKDTANANGVTNLTNEAFLESAMATFPASQVWGVGRGIRKTLDDHGIVTAKDLRDADTFWMKSEFGIKGLALTLELRGHVFHNLKTETAERKEILVTRTFGRRLSGFEQLAPPFAEFARRASDRLTSGGLAAKSVTAFVESDRFQPDARGASSIELELEQATADPEILVHLAHQALRQLLAVADYEYKKGGIILAKLASASFSQPTLFDADAFSLETGTTPANEAGPGRSENQIFQAMSSLNKKHGATIIQRGFPSSTLHWKQRKDYLSPRYTTNWNELPKAH